MIWIATSTRWWCAVLEWMSPAWFVALPLALLPWIAALRPWSLRFSSLASVRAPVGPRRLLAVASPLLQMLALLGVIISLARPQLVQRETVTESDGIDIMLAIDTSGSMNAPDMGTRGVDLTRLDAAKLVMQQFLEGREHDRVGLLVFGEEAFVQVPLTLDHAGLSDFVGQLDIGMAGKSGTAVGNAIAIAAKRMKELPAPSKVIILVTDGQSNAGQLSPLEAAQAAAALGIKVHTIGVGGAGGGGILQMFGNRGAEIDEPTLREVAATTGGKYWRAADTTALASVYGEIDKMEKSTAKVKEFVHRDERYRAFLLPAMACFLLDVLFAWTWLRRLP